jgi:hypothetical protein
MCSSALANLKIHVRVGGDEEAAIGHAPFQLDKHRFANEFGEKRLWSDGFE